MSRKKTETKKVGRHATFSQEVADKQVPKQLQPYIWKKGVSGNPNGRPRGKTLKEFAREYLESLPDDEKVEYLASLPTEIVWRMAEGNPATNTDITSGGEKLTITFDGAFEGRKSKDSSEGVVPQE